MSGVLIIPTPQRLICSILIHDTFPLVEYPIMATCEGLVTTQNLSQIMQKHEDDLMDLERMVCLLCKRLFKSKDLLKRHQSLSELHATRLRLLKKNIFSPEQLEKLERKERESLYRDRARERRLKYGQPDRMIPLEPMLPVDPSNAKSSTLPNNASNAPKPLGLDNKGAALLSKMGWREGTGLGRNNEGMTDILRIESHVGTSGLGSRSYKPEPGLSYKDAVKKVMYQRYYEISSKEDQNQEDQEQEQDQTET